MVTMYPEFELTDVTLQTYGVAHAVGRGVGAGGTEGLLHLMEDTVRCGGGVGCLCDRTADDQIVGAGSDGLTWGRHPGLVIRSRTRRSDRGRQDAEVPAKMRLQTAALARRCHHASQPG